MPKLKNKTTYLLSEDLFKGNLKGRGSYEEELRKAKKFYNGKGIDLVVSSNLVEAILTRVDDIDFDEAYNVALSILTNRLPGRSPFDALAQQRRRSEAAILNEEVDMFREMRRLLGSIARRYDTVGANPINPDSGESS